MDSQITFLLFLISNIQCCKCTLIVIRIVYASNSKHRSYYFESCICVSVTTIVNIRTLKGNIRKIVSESNIMRKGFLLSCTLCKRIN